MVERSKKTRGWKPGTVVATRTRLNHLKDAIGDRAVASIRQRDVAALVDRQLETFAAKTVTSTSTFSMTCSIRRLRTRSFPAIR